MSNVLFSLEEVAQNNGKLGNQIWIVIKDIVYNVTDYLPSHPGGRELLLEYAGKDATTEFYHFGHSNDAKNVLKSLKIGQLIEVDRAINKKKKVVEENIVQSKQKGKRSRKILITFFRKCGNCL